MWISVQLSHGRFYCLHCAKGFSIVTGGKWVIVPQTRLQLLKIVWKIDLAALKIIAVAWVNILNKARNQSIVFRRLMRFKLLDTGSGLHRTKEIKIFLIEQLSTLRLSCRKERGQLKGTSSGDAGVGLIELTGLWGDTLITVSRLTVSAFGEPAWAAAMPSKSLTGETWTDSKFAEQRLAGKGVEGEEEDCLATTSLDLFGEICSCSRVGDIRLLEFWASWGRASGGVMTLGEAISAEEIIGEAPILAGESVTGATWPFNFTDPGVSSTGGIEDEWLGGLLGYKNPAGVRNTGDPTLEGMEPPWACGWVSGETKFASWQKPLVADTLWQGGAEANKCDEKLARGESCKGDELEGPLKENKGGSLGETRVPELDTDQDARWRFPARSDSAGEENVGDSASVRIEAPCACMETRLESLGTAVELVSIMEGEARPSGAEANRGEENILLGGEEGDELKVSMHRRYCRFKCLRKY